MCLVALAIDASRRFPLVVATNRDEFFDRPASRLGWWQPDEGGPQILSGRDLAAGGTWMGLTTAGRFALVTNVRRPFLPDPEAPSRGRIVPRWLATSLRPDQFWMETSLSGYAPFNLIAADFHRGDCFWASSEEALPRRIERGIFGLSNAGLDTPWPKVTALKARVADGLEAAGSVDDLAARLFDALADRRAAPDRELPDTGIDPAFERLLSAAFIRTEDGRYGTRCSTVIVAERVRRSLVTHVLERTFTPTSPVALLRRARLAGWPPRYASTASAPADPAPVSDASLDLVGSAEPPAAAGAPARRTRVRTLLRPSHRLG